MIQPQPTNNPSFLQQTLGRFDNFKTGFMTGFVISAVVVAGAGHLLVNVLKFGAVTIGDHTFGQVGSPSTQTEKTVVSDASSLDQDTFTANGNENIQAKESEINQTQSNVNNPSGEFTTGGDITAGDGSSITITVNSNAELPGFNPRQGYRAEPPDISEFNDALLIKDVSFGSENVKFQTNAIFINKRRYNSTFHLYANNTAPKRVGFSLGSTSSPKGIFLQFGLGDWTSGNSTLTYFVSIFGDGNILWSGQVKYQESQVVSVILDVKDYNDILIEYQVVETGDARPYDNPLFFTEANLLF